MKSELIDLTGMKFGRWLVISRAENKGKIVMWNCVCDCGTKRVVQGTSLKNGSSVSCRCYMIELHPKTHGQSHTKLYRIWQRIKGCTRNKNHEDYLHYGARGIEVCDEWNDSFEEFEKWAKNNGYEISLEIDRINNDGNYEPSNCRFISHKDNVNNRRNTIFINDNGIDIPLSEYCRNNNLNYSTEYKKVKRR